MADPSPTAVVRSVRSRVRDAVVAAWDAAVRSGALPQLGEEMRPVVEIERPANPEHGDLASSLALKLARPLRRSPMGIADALAAARWVMVY